MSFLQKITYKRTIKHIKGLIRSMLIAYYACKEKYLDKDNIELLSLTLKNRSFWKKIGNYEYQFRNETRPININHKDNIKKLIKKVAEIETFWLYKPYVYSTNSLLDKYMYTDILIEIEKQIKQIKIDNG